MWGQVWGLGRGEAGALVPAEVGVCACVRVWWGKKTSKMFVLYLLQQSFGLSQGALNT